MNELLPRRMNAPAVGRGDAVVDRESMSYGQIAVRLFWSWVLVNVVVWLVSLLDGSLHESMLQIVDQVGALGAELGGDRDQMARSLASFGAVYFILNTGLGAFLVHRAAAGRGSLFVFGSAALWWAYESISGPSQLVSAGWFDWVLGALGGVVWVVILVCAVRVRRIKTSAAIPTVP